jgi:hypothetical protein
MYSSIAQLRMNLTQVVVTAPNCDDATVTDRINHADDDIGMDLGKYVNFSLIPSAYSDTNFPTWLNHLSQYKTCEHMLAKLYGAKRTVDQVTDIQYWTKQYDDLLLKIKTNRVEAVLPDGTNVSKGQFTTQIGRTGISPVLGSGPYGEFESEDGLAKDRPRSGSSSSNPFDPAS